MMMLLLMLKLLNKLVGIKNSNIEEKDEISIGQALLGQSGRDPLNDRIAYFKSPSLSMQLVDSLAQSVTSYPTQ